MVEFWCCSKIDTHYTLRGSDTVRGAYCGTFCNRLNDTYGDRYWHFGAALPFILHIMLIEVDLLVMDTLVVCFIFLLMEPLILLIGIVVLLYF